MRDDTEIQVSLTELISSSPSISSSAHSRVGLTTPIAPLLFSAVSTLLAALLDMTWSLSSQDSSFSCSSSNLQLRTRFEKLYELLLPPNTGGKISARNDKGSSSKSLGS